jgi:hypothetical protein
MRKNSSGEHTQCIASPMPPESSGKTVTFGRVLFTGGECFSKVGMGSYE